MEKTHDLPFESLLQQLKPLVLRLPELEKHRVKLWLKKLNDVSANDVSGRRARLMYLHLLKTMLEKGELESPFDSGPLSGPLQPLPSYLTMFFDVPTGYNTHNNNMDIEPERSYGEQYRGSSKRKIQSTASRKRTSASLPDLSTAVTSDDEESDDEFAAIMRSVNSAQRRPPTPNSYNIPKMFTSTPGPIRTGIQQAVPQQHQQQHSMPPHQHSMPPHQPAPSPNIPVQMPLGHPMAATSHSMPNYKAIIEKEVQMKERLLSTRFNEEKMKIQRHHNELVQKIKDKSTKEVEQFRSEYRNKVLQLENNNKTLERRIQQLGEENSRIRDQRDRQSQEYKNLQQQSIANVKLEYEKKLQRLEKQKTEELTRLIQDHELTQQKLLDETTATMSRMEEEYKKHAETMAGFLKEQEEKNRKLREDNEELMTLKRTAEDRCKDLEVELGTLNTQLKLSEEKTAGVEADMAKMEKNLLDELDQHKQSAEKSAEIAAQEYSYNLNKAQEAHHLMEEQLKQTKQQKAEEAVKYENKIWDVENQAKSDLAKADRQFDKKLRAAEKISERKVAELSEEVTVLKKQIKVKEKEIDGLYEAQKVQSKKSEKALNDLKKEMQGNTEKLYKEVQEQVLTLEEDLEKEAFEREKIEGNYQQRIKEEKLMFEEKVAELQMEHEKEKQELIEKYHDEMQQQENKYEREKKSSLDQHEREIAQLEKRQKQRIADDNKVSQEFHKKIENLKKEINELKSTHAKELLSLEAERDRDRRDLDSEKERAEDNHKRDMEDARKKHSNEIETLTDKTNLRIKALQKELEDKLDLNTEALEKSKKISDNLEEELKRQALMYEKSIKKLQQEIEITKADEASRSRGIVKAMEQEVDTQRNMIKHLEKRLKIADLENQEKLSRMRLTYEERLKGVVPNTVREELEETIAALKAQSTILEQKATLLQSELEHRSKAGKPSPFNKKARSPYAVKAK